MHHYDKLKRDHGTAVSQTIDAPIMIFDFWELTDALMALLVVLVFGVIFYTWDIMFILLALVLVVGPTIKRKNNKGIYLHYPYRKLKITLPGLINPKGDARKYSD